ncbi:hypothetical protein [Paraburkholderia sp. UCT2]|uniref:hypothetical protein n=1 Tax=Paraburkholderia sp. UCT2 TaxID=2615208 RepID=UPI0016550E35|nr:hypothetical protein [Paraburkholderia sp. UCT2]MBC8729506.1 hypothetical protein [Paraburkholderia sp. UCT2]
MAESIQSSMPNSKKIVFGIYFFLLLLMALCPPFYLGVSGSTQLVLGVPLPIFYWIANAVLVGLGVWALYVAEGVSGELANEGEPT